MPAKSKAQFRMMQAVAHGGLKVRGLSKEEAKKFVHGVDYKSLSAWTKKKKALKSK